MRLSARTAVTIRCAQECPLVAMLRPRSGPAQWVVAQRYALTPWVPASEFVDGYGNLCQRFTAPQGEMSITVESEVEVLHRLVADEHAGFTPIAQLPDEALTYLLPSRYCPSDKLEERARAVVGGCAPGYAQAARICEWVHETLEYRYGVSCESTCALDTLAHGAGVCRDFAHVGVSLCRALRIPARYVVGYLLDLEPMDLHAWYEAFVGGRWHTFDPTQAAPRGGRIVVGYGRDVADVAFISNYGPLEITAMEVSVRQAG